MVSLIGYALVLALPLLITSLVPSISTGTTITIYAIGLVVDAIVLALLFALGVRFYGRAKRGGLFAIPLVTPIVDRLLPVRGVR